MSRRTKIGVAFALIATIVILVMTVKIPNVNEIRDCEFTAQSDLGLVSNDSFTECKKTQFGGYRAVLTNLTATDVATLKSKCPTISALIHDGGCWDNFDFRGGSYNGERYQFCYDKATQRLTVTQRQT